MTSRRALLLSFSAGVVAAPLACFAQQPRSKIARIGLLESGSPYAKGREALIAGLRELGDIEGKNIVVEDRSTDGNYERLPGLVADLLQRKVDIIVAASGPAILAAKQATETLPIVMVATADPIEMGFAASLSRPGRNITGLSTLNVDLSSKYLELLRAAVPKISRVAVLMHTGSVNSERRLQLIQTAGETSGVKIVPTPVAAASEIAAAIAAMKQDRAAALIVWPAPFFRSQPQRIAEAAKQQRLPSISAFREYPEAGGLMSYGQNLADQYYRAAAYVDKILKGAKPAELPIEQPTKFELVINLRTAKAIGVVIPQELLLRADKVIE